MATPLDLRNRRREAQRTVRLAINAVNAAMDSWKRLVTEGKQHASGLSNAFIEERHLPSLQLGALADVPGLIPAATAKLRQQQEQRFLSLKGCLQQLQESVQGLKSAVESITALVEVEAEAPLLGEGTVFATLSLQTIGNMLLEVHEMYAAELKVKEAVLTGLQQVPGEFLGRGQPPPGAPAVAGGSSSGSSSRGGGGPQGHEREERLRRRMEVYLAAWMLSPELDQQRAEAHVAYITEDMRGF